MPLPARDDKASAGSQLLSEAIVIAALTGVLYMMTSAREVGYQDLFDFRYIALDPADITDALQELVVPLVLGFALSLVVGLLLAMAPWFRARALPDVLFLVSPVCFALAFWWRFRPHDFFSPEIWWLIVAYYLLDVSLLALLATPLGQSDALASAKRYLRVAQIAAAALALIVFAYDTGRRAAAYLTEVTVCPGEAAPNEGSILVQQTGDLVICAVANWPKQIVYREFRYFKVPDGGEAKNFKVVEFHPKAIGVIRGSADDQ